MFQESLKKFLLKFRCMDLIAATRAEGGLVYNNLNISRKQLAEVIESHNNVVAEKGEILDDEEIPGRGNYGQFEKKIYKKKKVAFILEYFLPNIHQFIFQAYKKFNLYKYLQQESQDTLKQSQKAVLNDIQAEVVENLQLIHQLAEQVRKLDYEAYKVFSK